MREYLNKEFGLENKKALVTGAGRGIGRAIAEALAYAGADVVCHYGKSKDAAEQVVEGIKKHGGRAIAAGADFTDADQIMELFQVVDREFGALDILVNNVGDLVGMHKVEEFSVEFVRKVIDVNLFSTVFATKHAIPLLRKGADPAIVNIGSVAGYNGGGNGGTLYAACKAAVHAFTVGLAKELAPEIRVNAIAPGVIMTDFHRVHTGEKGLEYIREHRTPLKRIGEPEEIADAVVYLCGRSGSFVTGEIININGGLYFA